MMWLEPTSIILKNGTSEVTSWIDQSTNKISLQPATATNPTIETAPHPAIRFAGITGKCTSMTASSAALGDKLDFGTNPVLLSLVFKADAAVSTTDLEGMFYKTEFVNDPFKGIQIYANAGTSPSFGKPAGGFWGGTGVLISATGNTHDNNYHVITLARLGTGGNAQISLRYDGQQVGEFAASGATVVDTNNPLYVGNRPDYHCNYNGVIGDVLMVLGPSTKTISNIETYLMTKYGIN
jgi:hypothetical protein